MVGFAFDAIGTSWKIDTREELDAAFRERILERIERFEGVYSRFRPDSLVAWIADAPLGGCFSFPEDAAALFDLYDKLHKRTGGAVDPLVGRDLELLGYDRKYSFRPDIEAIAQHIKDRPNWSRDVQRKGSALTTGRPLVIDVGAVGKGYLVDVVASLLRAEGVDEFLVDASGDFRHSGPSGIRIGLEHPFDPDLVIGVADLRGQALCASAINRRAWGEGLHHVVDGRTGLPARDVVATWVMAESAAIADGLATALFFSSPEQLSPAFRFSYVRMLADGRAEISSCFEGELFT